MILKRKMAKQKRYRIVNYPQLKHVGFLAREIVIEEPYCLKDRGFMPEYEGKTPDIDWKVKNNKHASQTNKR